MFNEIKSNIDRYKEKKEFLGSDWESDKDRELIAFCIKVTPILLNAERCSIFIHNPETGVVWVKSGTGVSEKQIEVNNGQSIVGDVISTGTWKIVSNMEELPGPHRKIAEETGFITRNLLCVPILSLDGKNVTGAIEVLNKKDGEFNDEDRKLIMELGHFLQLTIENVYFNQEMYGHLESTFNTLKKVTIVAVASIIGLSALVISYWIGFSVLG